MTQEEFEKRQASAVSVFRDGNGYKWEIYWHSLQRNVHSVRTYTLRQSALRAGRRVYRRAFGPSIDKMLKEERKRKGQTS